MKDCDHNEAMADLFQAEPRFAATYLRQVLADGEPADVRAGLRQMADVLRVNQVAALTDSTPSTGLFDRAGMRYEVACDVIGALIAHYTEITGQEREQVQPDEAVLRVAKAMKAALAEERDDLDPSNSVGIEAAISHYAPLARRLYGPDKNDSVSQKQRRAGFDQGNVSPAREGLAMSADDLAVQVLLIRGNITHDEAVQCYRILHRYTQ
uniref:antitoxin VbhA family protein n=1 Tax=Laribacter hongkongensis TaxID=168471 RepID=UPI0015E86920|nr:antitoxin VbhA family protein [Laribacter hongkongensis]